MTGTSPAPTELETRRLFLHPPGLADAEEVFARYANDGAVVKYLSWAAHASKEETFGYLERLATDITNGKLAAWLIREKSTGRLLGSISYGRLGHRADLGYCLARDAWGHGFATEAVCLVSSRALAEPPLWRIAALCDAENVASARVLEKCGFHFEGTLRKYFKFPNLSDVPRDVRCYSRVRAGS